MMAQTTTPVRLFGEQDGHDPGIEAYGLLVRIEVGQRDLGISAMPIDDDGWRDVPLDERLPNLVRALSLMMEIRAAGRGKAPDPIAAGEANAPPPCR